MKLSLESTTKIVSVSAGGALSIECRVWEGVTERGVRVQCLIPRIAVKLGRDMAKLEAEYARAPSVECQDAFPLRMIL